MGRRIFLVVVLACSLHASSASTTSTCGSTGIKGILNAEKDVCCPTTCGTQCGGTGCDKFPGGASQCCSGDIRKVNKKCVTGGAAPCVISSTSTSSCSTGILNSTKDVCCPKTCGTVCGGNGCDKLPGGPSQCCSGDIKKANKKCGTPPCVISSAPTSSPTTVKPTSGGACASTYKQCGGKNFGSLKCCSAGDTCQVQLNSAGQPNIYYSQCRPASPTPKPTSKPTTPAPTSTLKCPNSGVMASKADDCCEGPYGLCSTDTNGGCCANSYKFCCPSTCKTCDDTTQCVELVGQDNPWGPCCTKGIYESCNTHAPPCRLPTTNACTSTTCKNGGHSCVSYRYGSYYDLQDGGACQNKAVCECVNGYGGQYCEIAPTKICNTANGEAYCVQSSYDAYAEPPFYGAASGCCTKGQHCERLCWKTDCWTGCYYDVEPTSCDPNPCKNSGTCGYSESARTYYYCTCTPGYTGAFCEIKI